MTYMFTKVACWDMIFEKKIGLRLLQAVERINHAANDDVRENQILVHMQVI